MEQQQQQRERKLRLNKMRERTKELLRNHDWERYFPMAVDISSSNATPNNKNNRLNCSLSAINHLDYDSLLMQTNINNNIVNNINQTPNNNNNKFQLNVMPFLVNTTSQKAINREENKTKSASTKRNRTQPKKPKRMVAAAESTGDEDEEGNYRLNMVPRGIRPSLLIKPVVCSSPCPQRRQQTPHQSFTFIAELAQTSTPTRNTQAPITSTPKQLTHDPLKYHPKQTIRCKKTSCCPIPQTTTTNRVVKQQQCVKCVKPRPTITSNKRKRSESCNNSSSDWDCNLCNISNVVNSMAVAVATSAKKKSRAVKIKTSHIEISLQDLLYAPTKSTKFDLVTTSRPRVRKQHSKVYYL